MRICTVFAVAAVLGTPVLSLAQEEVADKAAAVDDAAGSAGKATIKVIDAGQAPKQELRYKFNKGQVEVYELTTETAMEMTAGGQKIQSMKMPATTIRMKVATTEVADNGDATLSMEIVSSDVTPQADTPQPVVTAMKQAMAGMNGTKGTSVMTASGETRDVSFEVPADANPQAKQSLQNAEQQMSQLTAALPEEPIGKGAKWEATMPVEANGLKVTQTITYTVSELDDKGATLLISMDQSADDQAMAGPGVPPGMKIEKFRTTGTGTCKLDFGKVVPADFNAQMNVNMDMAQEGNKMNMQMNMALKMKPVTE